MIVRGSTRASLPVNLRSPLAHSPDRGRFRSGIGGRHGDDRQAEIARDDLGKANGSAAAGCDEAIGAARRRDACLRHWLGHVQRGLRMQPRRSAAQNFDQPAAEAGAAAGRGDHQRAVQAEPRRFVREARDCARREHDALALDIMNEGCDHPTRQPTRLPTARQRSL
jgi:hypothetical protein